MASERVTVTVESNLGGDGPLTVKDGLGQVIELFDLLTVAGEHFSQGVGWSLVSISKNSPLSATAEAFATNPGVDVEYAARHIKYFVASALESVTQEDVVPNWMSVPVRERVRSLLRRNLNGIGRTGIYFHEEQPPSIIIERTARAGLASLDRHNLELAANEADLSHSALGSAEGVLEGLTTYHGKPAIKLHERLANRHIACVLSDDLTKDVGRQRVWQEVWVGKRVRAVGKLFYKRDGSVARILASDLISLESSPPKDRDILPRLPKDMSPKDYLKEIWSQERE